MHKEMYKAIECLLEKRTKTEAENRFCLNLEMLHPHSPYSEDEILIAASFLLEPFPGAEI